MFGDIITYVQDTHAPDGVRVLSCNDRSLTIELPSDFPRVGGLIYAMHTRFACECDLQCTGGTPLLTVWPSTPQLKRRLWCKRSAHVGLIIVALALVALIYSQLVNMHWGGR